MELIIGLAGLTIISLFAITLAVPQSRFLKIRNRVKSSSCPPALDPNSTLAVTLDVLAEMLESRRTPDMTRWTSTTQRTLQGCGD